MREEKIDQKDDLYMEIMQEPAFVPGMVEKKNMELENFLFNIVEQEPKKDVRRHSQFFHLHR